MSRFYNRRFEVLVDNSIFIEETDGRQFKITFEILVDFNGYHSYADIGLYNLKESTRQNVIKKGKQIGLRAGYADSIDFIFNGQIRNAFKERVGPNVITRVIAHGGPPPTATINQTFGKGVSVPTLIRACAKVIGLPLIINDPDFNSTATYARGYSLYGDPSKILDKLANTHGFNYTIENQRVAVVGAGKFRAGAPYIISQANGMEGIPEITEIGVDANVRLTPKIRIGGQVDVQSELSTFNFSNLYFQDVPANAGSGIYNVQQLRYSGDSWGDTWTTSV